MRLDCDIAIVGAGFTGLTAGREASRRGHRVVVIEARDRIGGRTWVDHRLGVDLELGGQWVHWSEPHLWAELTRYGLDITRPDLSTPSRVYWPGAAGPRNGAEEEYAQILNGAIEKFLKPAESLFPMPFHPYVGDGVKKADAESVEAGLRAAGLVPDEDTALRNLGREMFNSARLERIAYSDIIRKLAGVGRTLAERKETQTYSITGGTRALAQAIAHDSLALTLLRTSLDSVEQSSGQVILRAASDVTLTAQVAIVTIPLNALGRIAFDPVLSQGRASAIAEGSQCQGWKMWARLRGEVDPFSIYGRLDGALGSASVFDYVDGDTLVVCFGPDASQADFDNTDFAQALLPEWIPGLDVVGVAGHNWVGDQFSRQTWRARPPLVLTRDLPTLRANEGQIVFAGSDYSIDPMSTISSAIGQGLEAAKRAQEAVR